LLQIELSDKFLLSLNLT